MINGHSEDLEREAIAAAAAGAPLDAAAPSAQIAGELVGAPGPSHDEILAGYKLVCGELVDVGALAMVPAWGVTPAESGKLAGAMAHALLLWFPDQIIPPKYLALLAVAGVGFEIIQARRDPQTGKLRPARLPDPVDAKASTPAPAAAH